jgi:methyl-accepting chemotaxis protein
MILPVAIYTNLITLGLITLATIIATLFISHRLAGPMFRFEKELRAIGEGDFTKDIRLRKHDQMIAMANDMNRMTTSLREKILTIRNGLAELVESATGQNASQELIEGLKDLYRNIETNFKI